MKRCGFISRKPYGCMCHKGKRVRCTLKAGHSRKKGWAARIHWMGNHVYILDSNRVVKVSFDA